MMGLSSIFEKPSPSPGSPEAPKGPVVIGLGNPLLSDDTVGLKIVDALEARCRHEFPSASFVCLHNVGLELLDDLDGHTCALFVDCIRTGSVQPGHCHELGISDLHGTLQSRLVDSHGMNLATIVAMGERLGYAMPKEIRVLGVEGQCLHDFCEEPTPEVSAAISFCVERARTILHQWETAYHDIELDEIHTTSLARESP